MAVDDPRAAVGVEQRVDRRGIDEPHPVGEDRRAASSIVARGAVRERLSPSRAATLRRSTARARGRPSCRRGDRSQSPSRAIGGSALIQATCSGVRARRSLSTPPFNFQRLWNDSPGTLVSSSAEPVDGEEHRLVVAEQAADRAVALALEPPDEVDRADAVGAAVDEVADSQRRASAPVHRSPASTSPASRSSPTSTSRWPWTSPTTKTGCGTSSTRRRGRTRRVARLRSRRGSSTSRRSSPTSSRVSPSSTRRSSSASSASSQSGVDRRARDQVDLRMLGRRDRLAVADEHLVELLARARGR